MTEGGGEGLAQAPLAYTPPLAWDTLMGFLASRGAAGVEVADGRAYRRTMLIDGHRGWVSVEPGARDGQLSLRLSDGLLPVADAVRARLRRLLDLDADPVGVDARLGADPRLAPLVARLPGLRVPGAVDGFELALRAVLGQQVTVKAATTLFGRFARAYGEPARTPWPGLLHYAPQATRVAAAPVQELIDLGLTSRRAATISTLAQAVAGGQIRLEADAPRQATLQAFLDLPGIGPWTAQYVAMRALRDADALPAADLGLMKALDATRPAQVEAASQAWRPYRAYAALHLWNSLKAGG